MNQAFVYDALRTPRGRGKKDGSLHEVKPIRLLSGVLRELREAGMPVVGSLFPLGVERGKLEVEYDELVSDEWVWRWVDA